MLNRKQVGQIYRPNGPKLITSTTFVNNGKFALANAIDLSLPLRGIRLVFKGRVNIATAAYTNINPESILNLISRIYMTGQNTRQGGNVTFWDLSLADAFMMSQPYGFETAIVLVKQGAGALTDYGDATIPFANIIPVTVQANDFIVVIDLPFHPHSCPAAFRQAFAARMEELKSTLQLQITFGNVVDNAENPLGLSAATTVTTISAFGGGGNATLDIYGLPMLAGLDLKDSIVPGVISRSTQPINTTANQNAGQQLQLLQQLKTTRIYVKSGTSTLAPYFKTLSDAIITTLGLKVGGNRIVREDDDIYAHKMEVAQYYQRPPIQGVTVLDFIQSGSPFSAYPGDEVGQGVLFQLTGAVTGTVNGTANVIQEAMLHQPEGALYN